MSSVNLESISLCGTRVGDEKIEDLCRLTKAQKLMIANTLVTDTKIDQLRIQYPVIEFVESLEVAH